MVKIRHWLRTLRKNTAYTQQQIAEIAEISRAYYAQLESGTRNPSVIVAQKISEVLSFEWTLFFENECSKTRQKIK